MLKKKILLPCKMFSYTELKLFHLKDHTVKIERTEVNKIIGAVQKQNCFIKILA